MCSIVIVAISFNEDGNFNANIIISGYSAIDYYQIID